jgi:hypothetical protein
MIAIVRTDKDFGKGKPAQSVARFSQRKTATFRLARVLSRQQQTFNNSINIGTNRFWLL